MPPRQKGDAQIRTLYEQGQTQTEIARTLNMPRSTVRDRLHALGLVPAPAPESQPGVPDVHNEMPEEREDDLRELVDMLGALREVAAWWRERKAALNQAADGSRTTERRTFHVEQRWFEAICRQADLDGLTYTHIVNEAFRLYFEAVYT